MPVGAQGSASRLYMKTETTDGTAATGAYAQLPFFTCDLGASQELQSDILLGAATTRDASDPYVGLVRVQGSARVPIDSLNFPNWLRLLMGPAVVTGTAPYSHLFKSGATTLPSATIEKAFVDKTRYHLITGVRANTLSVDFAPDGVADATVGLMARNEVRSGTSGAGTPTLAGITRYQRTTGAVRKDAVALAEVTGGSFQYSNGMELVPTIENTTAMAGIDFGQSMAEGTLDLRYSSDTLETLAAAGTPMALDFTLTIDANRTVRFAFPRIFLQRAPIGITGPTGQTASHRWRAAFDATAACLMSVTQTNTVAAYS